jgi:hypothetical protein
VRRARIEVACRVDGCWQTWALLADGLGPALGPAVDGDVGTAGWRGSSTGSSRASTGSSMGERVSLSPCARGDAQQPGGWRGPGGVVA